LHGRAGVIAADPDALRRRAEDVRARITLSSIIGGDVALAKAGQEWVGLCPFHSDGKVGSFSVNDAKGIYKCFACGAGGDVLTYLQARKGMTFVAALRALEADAGIDFRDAKQRAEFDRIAERRKRAAADDVEKRRRGAWGLWMNSAPLRGTPAQDYLEGRGINFDKLGRLPGAIRYRHDCWCSEAGKPLPAMVTAMVLESTHMATHRTWLEYRRGRWMKAPLEKPKKILGNFAGAHISLSKGKRGKPLYQAPAGTVLYVSEGIEDGLTVAMALGEARVVAAASIENIGGIALPEAVRELVLIGQHDKPGSAADIRLEVQIAKHQDAGRVVRCMWPEPGFKDFNDQLMGKRMVA
jgi:hypothetical protein